MSLLDRYQPEYDFNEVHSLVIKGVTSESCYRAAMELDLADSRTSTWLIRLRGLPSKDLNLRGFTKAMKFTLLEEKEPEEFIYGFLLIKRKGAEWIRDKEAFISGSDPAETNARVVWHFSFQEYPEDEVGGIKCRTETRIQCLNGKTKFWFGLYWFIIRPFSGWIRKEILRLIKKQVAGLREND